MPPLVHVLIHQWFADVVQQRGTEYRIGPYLPLGDDLLGVRALRQQMRAAQAQGMERHLESMGQQATCAGVVMGLRGGQELDVIGVGQQRVQIKGAPVR